MPMNASAITPRPIDRLRSDGRRISRSDSPIGRAMPKMSPLGSRRATTIQSPTRCGVPVAALRRPWRRRALERRPLTLVRRVHDVLLIDRERNLSLIAAREGQHRSEHPIQVQRGVGASDHAAVFLHHHFHAPALDVHLRRTRFFPLCRLSRGFGAHRVRGERHRELGGRHRELHGTVDEAADVWSARRLGLRLRLEASFLDDTRHVDHDDAGTWRWRWGRIWTGRRRQVLLTGRRRDRVSTRGRGGRMEFHSVDEPRGVTEQRRDTGAHDVRVGIVGVGGARNFEQAIHASAEIRRHQLHALGDVGGALCGFLLRRALECVHRRQVREQGDGAQRQHRQDHEGDDETCAQRHSAIRSSLTQVL